MILQKPSDLGYIPKKIVSLVPSQTELLYYFGLEQETIGITKFCVHPEVWFQTKPKAGGTKTINFDVIYQLQPDLIIANKEENVKDQIEQLALTYNVWLTDVNNFADALAMIKDLACLTAKEKEADTLIKEINSRFDQLLPKHQTTNHKLKTAYLIWRNPYMAVGGDTFINDMLLKCGFENVFANKTRYPETTVTALQTANLPTGQAGCQLLLLSSEPYPFKQKHIDELSVQLPNCKIILVDGELFSWYGSRMLLSPDYFMNLVSSL